MKTQGIPVLTARILLALMFLLAGLSKFAGLDGTAGYIASKGLPMAGLLAFGTAALEVGGALLLIVGWKARWAALALAVFTLMASVLFHNYWAMPADQQMMQQLMFMKNLAVVGGLLTLFAFGPGSLSLDQRRVSA
ncbi:MAG TPA: DoxX family protein [Burkholderiaceae bacterium]|jgi:putative oxidoreductase